MEEYQLLIDLHKRAKRQGPGGDAETKKAIALAGLDQSTPLKIADIGCGTGAASMLLARSLNAQITAVDFLPDFIDVLKTNTENAGLSNKIGPLVGSMESLPFDNEEFDVIWSEGAIYNMGFDAIEWVFRYFLLGAVVVFPIWLISRLLKVAGKGGNSGSIHSPSSRTE